MRVLWTLQLTSPHTGAQPWYPHFVLFLFLKMWEGAVVREGSVVCGGQENSVGCVTGGNFTVHTQVGGVLDTLFTQPAKH